jgi:CBS-domain-containing membrane protein
MSSDALHTELVALPVREVMSQPVLAIGADAPLGEALSALIRTGLRHLVVIDDDARCLGVIADRALAAAWALDAAALECAKVRHILDRRPSVVGAMPPLAMSPGPCTPMVWTRSRSSTGRASRLA